ncbi:MAG: GAF domain-containing sensor histidine kinase [Eggerthellaceae bacterium]|jgi:two-component system sensor histidine kinase NreB|nr:GAF domain-containing sensor histidine kinase [Eggerthellaceae bacterium]MDR2721661.1 GAF domain-containing sensor histidine kinase [Coriobacteriaceae bacterium]
MGIGFIFCEEDGIVGASNFSETDLAGENLAYQQVVEETYATYGFDFVSLGLTAFIGAPLKWIYGAGAADERYKRIVLPPGRGIGGIVIKSGKPMMFLDIDRQIDPREYSSYPIVFAEDLRSFCALPLTKQGRVVGALLCAFRSVQPQQKEVYYRLIDCLAGKLCDLDVISSDFMYVADDFVDFSKTQGTGTDAGADTFLSPSALSSIITAQEDERRRISRELHDGIAQELVSTTFLLKRLQARRISKDMRRLVLEAQGKIDAILDEIHNLSVELRPSALDDLGLIPALKSQALVFEKSYGIQITFTGKLSRERFDRTLETQVYRICQEAILNAGKYSGSDTVAVAFEDSDGWIHATIADKGKGFDIQNPPIKGSGCGLIGIQERAHLIGASLKIDSSINGTTIMLVAPMGLREEDIHDSSRTR